MYGRFPAVHMCMAGLSIWLVSPVSSVPKILQFSMFTIVSLPTYHMKTQLHVHLFTYVHKHMYIPMPFEVLCVQISSQGFVQDVWLGWGNITKFWSCMQYYITFLAMPWDKNWQLCSYFSMEHNWDTIPRLFCYCNSCDIIVLSSILGGGGTFSIKPCQLLPYYSLLTPPIVTWLCVSPVHVFWFC